GTIRLIGARAPSGTIRLSGARAPSATVRPIGSRPSFGTFRKTSVAAFTLLILAALLEPAVAQNSAQRAADADLAAIEDFNSRFVEAINTGDLDALAPLTTDEHIMIVP